MRRNADNRSPMTWCSVILLVVSLFSLTSLAAEQNYEVSVRSNHSQQDTYVVVVPATAAMKANSDLAPGIYTYAGSTSRALPVLTGQVLGVSRGFSGIVDHFQIGNYSEKHEAIAIVDGKIHLFSQKSRPTKPESFIVLGSKETPVLDPLNKRPVTIDPIQKLDDIRVRQIRNGDGTQTIILSIRQPTASGGKGLTIAAVVRQTPKSEDKFELVTNPVVIDYDFYDTAAQLTAISPASDVVFSFTELDAVALPRPQDDPILAKWRAQMAKARSRIFAKKVMGDSRSKERIYEIPHYDVARDELVVSDPPSRLLLSTATRPITSSIALAQKVNPATGIASVHVGANDGHVASEMLRKEAPGILGRVDVDAKGNYLVFPVTSLSGGAVGMALASINNKIHAVITNQANTAQSLDLSSLFSPPPRSIQAVVVSVGQGENSRDHYLIVSFRDQYNRSMTYAVVLNENAGNIVLNRYVQLNSKYASAKEITNRVHGMEIKRPDGTLSHDILYDNMSTAEKTLREKPNPQTLKSPLINITRTKDTIVQSYLSAMESQSIIRDQLSYKLFSEAGANESQSGFYINHYPGAATQPAFIKGSVLKIPSQTSADLADRTISKVKLPSGSYSAEYKVSAVAFNPNPGLKLPDNRFKILIHVGAADNDTKVASSYAVVEVAGNFSQLIGATILPGRRDRALNMTLILMFKEDPRKAKGRNGGGVQTINFTIDGNAPHENRLDNRIINILTNTVERTEIAPTQLKSRLHYDTPGDLYWVLTPEKDVNDIHFKVKKLAAANAEELAPNRAGQRIPLRFNEKIEEGFESLFKSYSQWLMSYKTALERLPWWREFDDRQKANKGKSPMLFSKFEEFLENRASPGQPVRHEVLLVEESLKPYFRDLLTARLMRDDGRWSLKNPTFNFHYFEATANYKEVRENLDQITERANEQNMLVVDMAEILNAEGIAVAVENTIQNEEKPEGEQIEENEAQTEEVEIAEDNSGDSSGDDVQNENGENTELDTSRFPHSRMMALAEEGNELPLSKFKALQRGFKLPMLFIATPAEWQAMVASRPDEKDAGVFDSFTVNASFLTSTWSLWPVSSGKATDEIKTFAKLPVSRDEFQVFTELEKILADAASPNAAATHKIVVIPNELKPLVRKLVLSRWATDRNIDDSWTHKNPNLSLFNISQDQQTSQTDVFQNFEALNGSVGSRRPVLLADMADILKTNRPTTNNGSPAFFLKDPAAGQATSSGLTDTSAAVSPKQLPHLMWLIASEGKKVQPKKTRDWKIKQEVEPKIPMVIFASEEDLSRMEIDTAFERRFVNFKEEFDIVTLPAPSSDVRRKLIYDLFNRPEIASLNYEFAQPPLNSDGAKERLIGVMVNRLDQIATQFNQEPTTAFLRAYSQLRITLTDDPAIRRSRMLDNAFFERLYRKVFSIPLSFDILEDSDPLNRLRDPDKASLRMQELGYEGSPDPRRQVIETVISQTKANDQGRPIPSSAILFGGTSTGKTFLLNTLFKLMNLKFYDLDRPNEEGVSVFKINVGQITEKDDETNPSKMSITSIKKHLEHFLSQPNGARGMIFFDDFNRGSTEIKKELKAFIYNLMDSKNGMITVQNLQGDRVEMPIRNLSLFLTVNPQQDLEIKRRFTKEYGEKSLDDEIIAALASDGFQIDNSFTARFSLKLDMDKFPRDAKVPAVLSSTREFNLNEFSSRPRFVLVTPQLADALTNAAPNGNAREFITPAANALLEVDGNFEKAPVYILRARGADSTSKLTEFGKEAGAGPAGGLDGFKLKQILKDVTIVQPVTTENLGTQIDFASFILNNFRTHLHNAIVMEAQRSPRFVANKELRVREMSSFLMAVMHNITDASTVPFRHVRMHPDEVEARDQRDIFSVEEAIRRNSEGASNFLKVDFQSDGQQRYITANEFLGSGVENPSKRTRATVLAETTARLQIVLKQLLGEVYYLGKLDEVDPSLTAEEWAARITNEDQKAMFAKASAQLIDLYGQFSEDIYSPDLLESIPGTKVAPILDYDRARLFMMAVDKALTQLPWAKVGHVTTRLADQAVNDLAFGLSANLQTFLFKSTYSPMATITPDSVETYARSSEDLRDFEAKRSHLREGFLNKCDSLLTKEGPR